MSTTTYSSMPEESMRAFLSRWGNEDLMSLGRALSEEMLMRVTDGAMPSRARSEEINAVARQIQAGRAPGRHLRVVK